MDDSVRKGLEGALRAAVEANGSGSANGASVNGLPDDTAGLVNLFVKALPKLLANAEAPDDMAEQMSDALARLRKETRMLRREVRELSLKMDVVCDQQAMAITQLARIQLVDPAMHGDLEEDDEVEDDDDEIAEEVLEPYRARRRTASSRNAVERTRNKGRRRKA